MKVHFFATLREITGTKTVEINIAEGATVGELIEAIVDQYPAMRDKLLDPEGNLYGHVHVFVNGRDAPYLEQALDTVLKADDVLSVFPAVGGG